MEGDNEVNCVFSRESDLHLTCYCLLQSLGSKIWLCVNETLHLEVSGLLQDQWLDKQHNRQTQFPI